jgi:hypothetical protein
MLMKPIFMLLSCPFNFGSDHPNAKVSVDVAITGVKWGIYYSPQYFVLELLYYLDVALADTTPHPYSISTDRFYDLVVYQPFSGLSPAGLMAMFNVLRFQTPTTRKARWPYLYPSGTGCLTPGTVFPFRRLLRITGGGIRTYLHKGVS